MTWTEFTTGLRTVAEYGSSAALPAHVRASLEGLRMIAGSEGDCAGVTLTESGRLWYQRTVVDRENERILAAYARVFDAAGMNGAPYRDVFNPEGHPDTCCDECGIAFYAGIGASVICDACLQKRAEGLS